MTQEIFEENIVDCLVGHFGNIDAASKGIGRDVLTITQWRRKGFIPAFFGDLIEEKTNGAITAADVRLAALKCTARSI